MSNLIDALESPSLDWPEDKLLKYLADSWNMPDPEHIRIIGYFRPSEKGGHGFIENLHHFENGSKLPNTINTLKLPQVIYVHPKEASAFKRNSNEAIFLEAEIELSPLNHRQEKNNPLSCMVRTGTANSLKEVPKQWKIKDAIKTIEGNYLPLVTEIALEAIKGEIQHDMEDALRKLDETRHIINDQEAKLKAEQQIGEQRKQELQEKHKMYEELVRSTMGKLDDLQRTFELRRDELKEKLHNLENLLRERGERLIALDVIAQDDLDLLIPPEKRKTLRDGHAFNEVLDNDFLKIAPFIQARLWKKSLIFSQTQILNFLALIKTRDLIILAGDSGSGKTSLVRAVADSIGGRCTIIPVKPNWTGPEDLLGYYNPIEKKYHATPFLLALQAAEREPDIPHFICLDEMNLARVEYYFSDFLSLLEDRENTPEILLYSSDEEQHVVVEQSLFLAIEEEVRNRTGLNLDVTFFDILKNEKANDLLHKLGGFKDAESVLRHHARLRRSMSGLLRIPCKISFPKNVWIIGAINIDETTHYLSPKVLDRAHILRFRNPMLMDWEVIEQELEQFDFDIDLPVCLYPEDLGSRKSYPAYDRKEENAVFLTKIAKDYLDALGIEFGLRAIRQSLGYLQATQTFGMEPLLAFDHLIQQKILPKMIFDASRNDMQGHSKRELLINLRDEIDRKLQGLRPRTGEETSVMALERLIWSIDSNNGIANYWLR